MQTDLGEFIIERDEFVMELVVGLFLLVFQVLEKFSLFQLGFLMVLNALSLFSPQLFLDSGRDVLL